MSTMKVVVSIPTYNEENTIGAVVAEIPRDIADQVLVVIVDDGCSDKSVERAKKAGADVIVSHRKNKGLAKAFNRGIAEGLKHKADIIINTDADGQYVGGEITKLIKPIVDGEADVVLGSRFAGWIEEMPLQKRIGNNIATYITSFLAGIPITDAQTGFRAFSYDAALKLHTLSEYTYTQENIIQAAYEGLKIVEVPITFRKREGKSRLISNIFSYAAKSGITILKTYRDYKPLRTFTFIGGILSIAGFITGLRVLIHWIKTGMVTPYMPTAILTAVLLIIGFQVIVLGLIADMVGSNRKRLDEILYRQRNSD